MTDEKVQMTKKRKQTYKSESITVTFDPNLCIHAAVCVRTLPEVFDISKKRWVQPDKAEAGRLAEVVRSCPSGALQHTAPGERTN